MLGAGCFWSKEFYLGQLSGVISTHTGFAGGTLPAPTYQQVCKKDTGHAEVVRVLYDSRQLPLAQLLRYFFQLHDPAQDRRQNGGQYRSAIFFPEFNKVEVELAKAMVMHLCNNDINATTEVMAPVLFYSAEGRHQAYCDIKNITPRPPKGISNSYWSGFDFTT